MRTFNNIILCFDENRSENVRFQHLNVNVKTPSELSHKDICFLVFLVYAKMKDIWRRVSSFLLVLNYSFQYLENRNIEINPGLRNNFAETFMYVTGISTAWHLTAMPNDLFKVYISIKIVILYAYLKLKSNQKPHPMMKF